MINAKAKVNHINSFGETPLIVLAQLNATDAMRILRTHDKLRIDLRSDLFTALHHASLNNALEAMELLISWKADINAQIYDGSTSISLACDRNDWEAVELLLQMGADTNIQHFAYEWAPVSNFAYEWTPLHMAAYLNKLPILDLFCAYNRNLNVKDGSGLTPFILASFQGHVDFAKSLLNNDTSIYNKEEEVAHSIQVACLHNRLGMVKLFLEAHVVDIEDMHKILQEHSIFNKIKNSRDHFQLIKYLFYQGLNTEFMDNKKNKDQNTPLINWAKEGFVDHIEVLLNMDADVNAQNNMNQTSLMLAAQGNHLEIVKLLMIARADIDLQDNCKRNALYYALIDQKGVQDPLSVHLIEHGINLETLDNYASILFSKNQLFNLDYNLDKRFKIVEYKYKTIQNILEEVWEQNGVYDYSAIIKIISDFAFNIAYLKNACDKNDKILKNEMSKLKFTKLFWN